MNKDKVKEISPEDIKQFDPNLIKYMTFIDGTVAIIDSEDEDGNSQRKIQKNIAFKNQKFKVIKEGNNENKQEQNFGIQFNNKDINYEEIVDNQKNIGTNPNYEYRNDDKNLDNNKINNNNLNNFGIINENKDEEDEEINEKEKAIKIDLGSLGEKYDGDENINNCNSDINDTNKNNEQKYNKINYNNQEMHEIQFQDYNNSEPNYNNNDFMSQNQEKELIESNNNSIKNSNNINQYIPRQEIQPHIQNDNFNPQLKKRPPQQEQPEYNKNMLPNNYSKSINYYQKNIQKTPLNQEIPPEILNQQFLLNRDTKVINAIPLEKYNENNKYQNYQNAINNNNNLRQKVKNENEKPKIFVATDPNTSNIIPQKNKEQFQLKKQSKIQDFRQENYYQNQNNNINNMKNNQQFEKEKIIGSNVLYPREGYGNDVNIQNQLKNKNKRKKIIYIRKKKPLVQQHFDVEIIQSGEEAKLSKIIQQYQIDSIQRKHENINSNNIINRNTQNIIKSSDSNEDNKVPPVINKYQNPSYFNNMPYQMPPLQDELLCTCSYPPQYPPIRSNNRIPYDPYSNEEETNYRYRSPPKQTVISITPMRTIKETNSPFPENIEFSYNNTNRYFRNERNRNKGFRTLSPQSYPNIYERQQYVNENRDRNYENNYNNEGRKKYSSLIYPQRRRDEPMIIVKENENVNRDNNTYEQYRRGQRMVRNDY